MLVDQGHGGSEHEHFTPWVLIETLHGDHEADDRFPKGGREDDQRVAVLAAGRDAALVEPVLDGAPLQQAVVNVCGHLLGLHG